MTVCESSADDNSGMNLPNFPKAPLNGIARLTHLGVIRVEGADAASFLQGQLSQDFVLLKPTEARLAAYCSAKGRMLASFIGFQHGPDCILLVCSRDLLPQTLKRLSMFVMRAKTKLSDATADFQLWGLVGSAIKLIANYEALTLTSRQFDSKMVLGLHPALGQARAMWLAPAADAPPAGEALPEGLWAWLEVHSGVATLTAPLVEAFVPQMLNYESVGGVNFKKGCYPGQEVVARSQFRGTLKRRAYLVHADAPLQPAEEVFHSADLEQACGQVVQAVAAPGGGWDAIISMQVAAAQDGRLKSAGGAALALLPLPYALLDDI